MGLTLSSFAFHTMTNREARIILMAGVRFVHSGSHPLAQPRLNNFKKILKLFFKNDLKIIYFYFFTPYNRY